MSFSCGVVGLPNVGKSTLFNGLTNSLVEAANYPFCTIEPNKAIVKVPDERVSLLSALHKSKKTIFTTIEFVDIAGLVKGASKGAGLGNKFISHISEVDAIVHVVRLFSDRNVVREGDISPAEDLIAINNELIFYDYALVEKHIARISKEVQHKKNPVQKSQLTLLEAVRETLLKEKLIIEEHSRETISKLKIFGFITAKPMLVVANIDEGMLTNYESSDVYKNLENVCQQKKLTLLELSAVTEMELCSLQESLDKGAMQDYLDVLSITQTGCKRLIKCSYHLLDLITFITTGEDETRAWTITRGSKAPKAAGVIHSDFERGFIAAEVVPSKTLLDIGSYQRCKEKGKIRQEGKAYEVQDGDVCVFKFNL